MFLYKQNDTNACAFDNSHHQRWALQSPLRAAVVTVQTGNVPHFSSSRF